MFVLKVPYSELYDETKNEFISVREQSINLEHSLVSISKWESRWKKSFLSKGPETIEETLDYVKCMTITQNVDPLVYLTLTDDLLRKVMAYVEDPMTATTFTEDPSKPQSKKTITAEQIYSWMIALSIPMECQKWHLNRLLTLIRVCELQQNPPNKKMSKAEIMSRNKALNAKRRAAMNSAG